MKKIMILTFTVLFAFLSVSYAAGQEDQDKTKAKNERDSFYSTLQAKLGFSKTDCSTIRKAGYSPYFSFVLLSLAKEAGTPVSGLIKMRNNDGYSWQDMSEALGIDYESFMDKVDKSVRDNAIVFPLTLSDENKNTIATNPRKKGAK